jgi:hypothetical protein
MFLPAVCCCWSPQVEEDIPSPDAKPTYHDVVVSVVQVQDAQTMYYLANPENGKKVVSWMLYRLVSMKVPA